jgi:hypothetical protein
VLGSRQSTHVVVDLLLSKRPSSAKHVSSQWAYSYLRSAHSQEDGEAKKPEESL